MKITVIVFFIITKKDARKANKETLTRKSRDTRRLENYHCDVNRDRYCRCHSESQLCCSTDPEYQVRKVS